MADRWTTKLAVTVWATAAFAALLASYSAFRPVRDSLILEGNLDRLPLVFLGTLAVCMLASPVWSALLARRAPRAFVPWAFHAFAACALVFCFLVRARVAPIEVGRAFYIWSAVFNLFVVSVFWSLLADVLGPRTARSLYGPIAAGGTVGTLVGPLLTTALVDWVGTPGILVMSAVLLELAVIGVVRVRALGSALRPEDDAEAARPPGGGAFTGYAHVARSPYLLAIVGYVLCTSCAATFMYLEQARLVQGAIADASARTAFFARLDTWTAAITLVLQTLVAGPALRRLGPAIVLCVLPLVQLASIARLSWQPSLAVLAVAMVAGKSATHGLTRPARELLFTVLTRDEKYRAKNVIDTVGYRFGDVASSWLHAGLTALEAGAGALAAAALPLVAIWVALAAVLGAGFRRRLNAKEEP